MSRLSDDDLQRELDDDVEQTEADERKVIDQLASERTHEIESHGHDNRVDELSEERATHPVEDELDEPWVRPSSLEAPTPRPGMVQRWIRISVRGEADPRNVGMRSREGWRPRSLDTIPEEFTSLAGDFGLAPNNPQGRFIVDDLLLCEMPEKRYLQRKRHFQRQTARQMEAVEHDLEDAQVAGHQIVKTHKSSVSHPPRVVGRRVEAAED